MGKETRKYCYIVGIILAHVVMMLAAVAPLDYSEAEVFEFLFRVNYLMLAITVACILFEKMSDRFVFFTLICQLVMMVAYVSADHSVAGKIEFFGYVSNFVFTAAMIQLVMEFMTYRKERLKKQNE